MKEDRNYALGISECNNMIAIHDFAPERFEEMKAFIKQGRVEPVNAFFLEPSVNLSGGEVLAKMGIEGIRWQEKMLGARPRHCWAIDTCGVHDQMPQLCQQLGLDALVYVRCSPSPDKNIFWSESPDGSRILTLVQSGYADNLAGLFTTRTAMTERQLYGLSKGISSKLPRIPAGAPMLILGGWGDYSPPPRRKENPTEMLQAWKSFRPDCQIRFSGLSDYLKDLRPMIDSGKVSIPANRGGSQGYAYGSLWINCPRVKQWYRRDEHKIEGAEMLATAASLKGGFEYPVQTFYHGWLQMLLNMDRNTIWGAAAGFVFEDPGSWDVKDRFEWVEKQSDKVLALASQNLAGEGDGTALFNPANWERNDPLRLVLPKGTRLAGVESEAAEDGTILCRVKLPSTGLVGLQLEPKFAEAPHSVALPHSIETDFYSATVDPKTGDLLSLKAKPSGRELLGGKANALIADKQSQSSGDITNARLKRTTIAKSGDFPVKEITAHEGSLALTVEARGGFVGGASVRRVMRFYKHHPRIEFETELTDIPDRTLVFTEFPLAREPREIRRGIPFGFSRDDDYTRGITPGIRWSDYATPGQGGVALLDRGIPAREINGNVPVLYLLNAADTYHGYPNSWLSGKGLHRFEYALVPHDADWDTAGIPRLAWEYNCPVTATEKCSPVRAESFVSTSGNLILEAMRRDGTDLELHLVECLGKAGPAEVTLDLPHGEAFQTDLTGGGARRLDGGPSYRLDVKPQQIVTLRFRTARPVNEPVTLTTWEELVPEVKRPALNLHKPELNGHPPDGNQKEAAAVAP